MSATTRQIAIIHTLKSRLGLDDATYRQMLHGMTGRRSSKEITREQAGDVIEKLQGSVGGRAGSSASGLGSAAAGAVAGMDSPVAKKLRALWIAGWNLGVVKARGDRALLAFVERQTGVSHTRFLKEPGEGSKAIEGVKAWLAREAGVKWPAQQDAVESRVAVIDAQWQRLFKFRAVSFEPYPRPFIAAYAEKVLGHPVPFIERLTPRELDEVSSAFGKKLRAAAGGA
ncbi:MAG: regulatory protein GemA [Xanthobacteraceae bacterium]